MIEKLKNDAGDLLARAVKTAAQVAIGAIGAAATIGEVNWMMVGSTVALSVVVCILNNVVVIAGKYIKERSENA